MERKGEIEMPRYHRTKGLDKQAYEQRAGLEHFLFNERKRYICMYNIGYIYSL